MTTEQLEALITEYNQAASEQRARLRMIYRAMIDRTGDRSISFSGGEKWTSNTFQLNDTEDDNPGFIDRYLVPRFVHPLAKPIEGYSLGEQK